MPTQVTHVVKQAVPRQQWNMDEDTQDWDSRPHWNDFEKRALRDGYINEQGYFVEDQGMFELGTLQEGSQSSLAACLQEWQALNREAALNDSTEARISSGAGKVSTADHAFHKTNSQRSPGTMKSKSPTGTSTTDKKL